MCEKNSVCTTLLYKYICIYIERERELAKYVHIHMIYYIYIYLYILRNCRVLGTRLNASMS